MILKIEKDDLFINGKLVDMDDIFDTENQKDAVARAMNYIEDNGIESFHIEIKRGSSDILFSMKVANGAIEEFSHVHELPLLMQKQARTLARFLFLLRSDQGNEVPSIERIIRLHSFNL